MTKTHEMFNATHKRHNQDLQDWELEEQDIMSTWNYRVAKNAHGELVIVEVYYDKQGNVEFYTEHPQPPLGEDIDDLRKDLQHMSEALDKPLFDKVI